MKTLNRILTIVLLAALAACNEGGLSNRTIPPIAGIVGGPDQPNGNGNVAMEIQGGGDNVVSGQPIRIRNISHATYPTAEITATVSELQHISVRGDVGDELEIRLTHPTEGVITRDDFVVPSPRISAVHSEAPSELGFIRQGHGAVMEGEGFCGTPTCSQIFVDADLTPIGTLESPRPGLLYFAVATNGQLTVGTHTLRLNVASGADGDAYQSNTYEVTVLPPE